MLDHQTCQSRILPIITCLVCLGCTALTGPGGYNLPAEDTSLDPGRLAVGVQYYHCGHWDSRVGRPITNQVFADVFFTGDPQAPFLDHPLSVHRFILEAMGATIIRTYHLPGFRVWIPTDSVPPLAGLFGVIVRAVPDPRRYDLVVDAFYGAHNFGPGDTAQVRALGGVVVTNYDALGQVVLEIPERSVESIRLDARVQWVVAWADFLCASSTLGLSGELRRSR